MGAKSLTQDLLNQLLEYKDGKLFWKISPSHSVNVGDEAGSKNPKRYHQIQISGNMYYVHRIVFMMHNGFMPKYVDHIDRNTLNNKIENLRAVTANQSAFNTSTPKNNTSGVKNVNWNKAAGKWMAKIGVPGKRLYLGLFDDLEEAKKVVFEARVKYHAEYACHE